MNLQKDKLIYKGPIRDGVFGTLTKETYEVFQDEESKLTFLSPFPKINYESEEYRNLANNAADVETYFRLHDKLQVPQIAKFHAYIKRGDTVADAGCGGGAMLDYFKGIAGNTIAVEPFTGYHPSLKERGHHTFSSVGQALGEYRSTADVVLSMHVIEHVDDPVIYLKEIAEMLTSGGKCIITTPNLEDILLKLHFDEFAPFFFRKVHNYYFNEESLNYVAKEANMQVLETFYFQEFGLNNTLFWLRDNKPKGGTPMPGINEMMNNTWKAYLEGTGQANNIGIVLQKR